MILILEQDTRPCHGKTFHWSPELFVSEFDGKKTWRFCWGVWSLSWYASKGLQDFMKYIAEDKVKWYHD